MPRRLSLLIALLLSVAVPAHAAPTAATPGVVLVLADDNGPISFAAGGRLDPRDARVSATLTRYGFTNARVLASGPRMGGRSSRFLELTSARTDFEPIAAANELRATGRFRAVTPDVHLKLFATLPNDPYLVLQWYVDSPGADIHLPDAWDIEKGSASVVIGIMDTGVDLTHPDLASQIWTNPGEIAGNGLDDDGNGYVDDVHGWDFGNGNNDPNPHAVIDPTLGLDVGFHGTFVAAIASAATDNSEGIAGAGWNCRLMPLKVVDAAGDITLAAVTAAFGYAGSNGVDVLNMSFGGPGDPGVPEYFQALVDAATAAGVVCVAAAGNDSTSSPSYPAACANVLSVGATDENDARAGFSNFGSWVKVAAPGTTMWSAICQNYVIDDLSQLFYLFFFGWDGANPYMYGDGTSFACPLASGVCGLVRSRLPGLPPQAVIQHVIATGDHVTYDQPIGVKLNAYRAVNDVTAGVAPPHPGVLAFGPAVPNPFETSTTLVFALVAEGAARLSIYDCAGRRVRELANGVLPAGGHALRWDGADAGGRPLATGIYFARLEVGARAITRRLVLMH